MFNDLSFSECIVSLLGLGVVLRFGSLVADFWLSSVKECFHALKMHFQKPSK